jgi:hypothetical protein
MSHRSALHPTPAPRVHVPLFRPLEWNPEMGPISPPTEYACSGHDLIFSSIPVLPIGCGNPGLEHPPGIDPPQKFYKQNMVGRRDLRGPTSGSVCGHPHFTSWSAHIVASWQSFDHHLLFRRLGASFWIAGGIENSGVPFRELAAFPRGINHNEFGDTQEFLAGSTSCYQMNITTILFRME